MSDRRSLRLKKRVVEKEDFVFHSPAKRGYKRFEFQHYHYKLGDTFYVDNPTGSNRYIAYLTSIENVNDQPVLRGVWLADHQHMILSSRGQAGTLKDLFQLEPGEVMFSDSLDEIPWQYVQERCTVMNKKEYEFIYTNKKERHQALKQHIYFCDRGFHSRHGTLLDEDWTEHKSSLSKEESDSEESEEESEKENVQSTPRKSLRKRKADQDTPSKSSKSTRSKSLVKKTPSKKSVKKPAAKKTGTSKETPSKRNASKETPSKKATAKESEEEDFQESEASSSDSDEGETSEDPSSESEPEPETKRVTVQKKYKINPQRFKRAKLLAAKLQARPKQLSEAMTLHEKASERLHVSAVPDALPCREEEFANIYTQLESAIEEGEGMCLYISGIPGTGKTATVNAVVRALNERVESQELMPFQYVELNGMKLSEPQQAYVQLWEHISGQRVGPSYAESLLLTHFTTPRPGRQPCVVLIDELDLLVARKQKLVYNFFEWPNLKHSRLIVIAIANTMDLPERELTNKVSSRLGLTRISFLPYTFQQLISIIGARLEGVVDIDAEAIEFCARKVSSVVGDARRALDLCRRGIEMAEKEGKDKITWKHIEAAFRDLFSSPVLKALKHLSYHQLLFLVSILRQIRVTGMAQVSYGQVTEEHYKLCYQQNKKPPSYVDMCNICTGLSQYRLIISELKSDPTQKIQLNFNEQDLITVIGSTKDDFLKNLFRS